MEAEQFSFFDAIGVEFVCTRLIVFIEVLLPEQRIPTEQRLESEYCFAIYNWGRSKVENGFKLPAASSYHTSICKLSTRMSYLQCSEYWQNEDHWLAGS